MDPRNLNQNDGQMASDGQMPQAPVNPGMPQVPTNFGIPQAPVNPAVAASPAVPAGPEMPQMPTPVNPVVNPGAGTNPNVAMPAIDPSLVVMDTPNNQMGVNVADVMVGATDPITMPNLPKAPDPIEEELKAPMTAAAPVPGSIGSAISMPAEQPQMPNVAFNDPAMQQQDQAVGQQAVAMAPAKKKMDKKTLIMLCAVAGIAVVALVIVLVMMMNN